MHKFQIDSIVNPKMSSTKKNIDKFSQKIKYFQIEKVSS